MRATSEPLANRKRVELKNGAKSFTHFPLLPTELRHLVYSKVTLFDRVIAVKSSPEAEAYFIKNRVKCCMKIGLAKEQKNVYVKVQYFSSGYTEMHRIPDELKASVRRDILSSVGCRCEFCDDRYFQFADEPDEIVQLRYYDNGANFADTVFGPLNSVVEVGWYLQIKSAPVGGLVDLLQPSGKLFHRQQVPFWAMWHLRRNSYYRRNDPKIRVGNWGKWIDNIGTDDITINNNCENGPIGYIHQDFFDLPAFQTAAKVSLTGCNVDISDQQLFSMKARKIYVSGEQGSNRLTELGVLEFYKTKIKEWLLVPETTFKFEIKLENKKASTALYMNRDKLLEDVREELKTSDFLIDPEFHLLWREQRSHSESCVLIEHVKSKRALEIDNRGLCTVDDPRVDYADLCRIDAEIREDERNGVVDEDSWEEESEEDVQDEEEDDDDDDYSSADDYSSEDDQDDQDDQDGQDPEDDQ